MRQLILMRHAKAEKGSPSGGDHDRPLAGRGRDDAARIGRALSTKGMRPDLVLVSDSVRTRETWEALADLWPDAEVRVERGLYNASSSEIDAAIDGAAEGAETVLVIAHNPGIHDAAMRWLDRCAPSPTVRDQLAGRFPTGSAAVFTLDGRACGYGGVVTPKAVGGGSED